MRGDPVFPSLGSTIGGVATHSYVVGDAPGASTGSLAGPVTYVAFQQPVPSANQQDEIRTVRKKLDLLAGSYTTESLRIPAASSAHSTDC